MATRKYPPLIPDTDCNCVPSPGCKGKPCFPCGMTLEEQIMHVNDKVEMQTCTYNQVMKECYKTLRNLEYTAEENGAYYGKDEVWSEQGYYAEEKAIYTVTHKAEKDRHDNLIEMQLYLPYENAANSKIEQGMFDASYALSADKLIVAQPKTANGWYGKAIYKGAPITAYNDGTLYTVGFTNKGAMKVYQNGVDTTELLKDCIVNSMGCSGMLIKDGVVTDESYRTGIPNATEQVARVAIGQNSKTKEVMILSCGKENESNKMGLTSEACAQILLQNGCDIAVELCEAGSAGSMDKGQFVFTPDANVVPTAYCYWVISRKEYYAGDYVQELAELTQKYGRVIWNNHLTGRRLATETASRITADNKLQAAITEEGQLRIKDIEDVIARGDKTYAKLAGDNTYTDINRFTKDIEVDGTRSTFNTNVQMLPQHYIYFSGDDGVINGLKNPTSDLQATNKTYVDAQGNELQENINAEADTRATEDAALQESIDAEATRAKAAEAAETARAEAAYAKVNGDNTFTGVNSFENADTVFVNGFSVESADKAAATFTSGLTVSGADGEINFSGNAGKISGLKTPAANGDAANKKYVDDAVAAGGGGGSGDVTAAGDNTFTGSNTFNGDVTIAKEPTTNTQAANKKYVDDELKRLHEEGNEFSGNNSFTGSNTFSGDVTITKTPIYATDATNKAYVDNAIDKSADAYASKASDNVFTGANEFTGKTTIIVEPTEPHDVTNKDYVDQSVENVKSNLTAAGDNNFTGNNNFAAKTTFSTITGDSPNFLNIEGSVAFTDVNAGLFFNGEGGGLVAGLKAPANSDEAANKGYVDTKFAAAGDVKTTANNTFSGTNTFNGVANFSKGVNFGETIQVANIYGDGTTQIKSIAEPTEAHDAATKYYVDTGLADKASLSSANTLTGHLLINGGANFNSTTVFTSKSDLGIYGNVTIFNGKTITGLPAPVKDTDAVNKKYVDDALANLNVNEVKY